MKKMLICLFLASLLLLEGCASDQTDHDKGNQGTSEIITVDNPAEDDDYLELPTREAASFQKFNFSFHSVPFSVTISLPEDWKLADGEGMSKKILRNGEEIGAILAGEANDLNQWKIVATRTTDLAGFPMMEYIEKSGAGETLAFRYRYFAAIEKDGQRCSLTLTAKYSELGSDSTFRLLNHTAVTKITGGNRFGDLTGLEKANIAILGNSFIGSSRVGNILQEMLTKNGKDATITPYSRGYATVNTYVSDTSLMSAIQSGRYDAVFLCGFYSSTEAGHLKKMKEACDASGTSLVIFPAHNENRTTITSASSQYPALYLMDWKQEIDLLIKDGIDKWDFCINDQHLHSTPLAGYVGAHMIYRAIYNELPKSNYNSSHLDMSQVQSLLGDYLKNGMVGDAPIYLD